MERNDLITIIKNFLSTNGYSPLDLPKSELTIINMLGCLEYVSQQFPEDAPDILFATILTTDIKTISQFAHKQLTVLANQGNNLGIDKIYSLAIEYEHQESIQILYHTNFQPKNQEYVHLFNLLYSDINITKRFDLEILSNAYLKANENFKIRIRSAAYKKGLDQWVLLVDSVDQITQMKEPGLIDVFPTFSEIEKQIFLTHLFSLAAQSNLIAKSLVWKLFIFHDNNDALDYAQTNNCLPEDPAWLALFYFLTKRWIEYKKIDFNHKLLGAVYQVSNQTFRMRLLHHSRIHGQVEWMTQISRSSNKIWLEDLTDTDWDNSIRYLDEMKNYPDLWRLIQFAPPLWGNKIINILVENQWNPGQEGERVSFFQLKLLSKECAASPLMLRPTTTFSSSINPISCIQLDSTHSRVAIGCETGQILIYNLYTKEDIPPLSLSSPSKYIRAMAFDYSGDYLAASTSDHRIRVYRLKDGQIIKNLDGHTGLIRSLIITPDSKQLFSTSLDGSIRQWQFPSGHQVKVFRQDETELLSSALSSTGAYLLTGGIKPSIEVWNAITGTKIREICTGTSAVTSISSSAQVELFTAVGNDNSIQTWNFSTGQLINKISDIPVNITHLNFHPFEPLIIASGQDGIIFILSAIKNTILNQFYANKSPGIGICVSENGKYFLSANQDGAVYYWNLEGFLLTHLPISYATKFGLQNIIARQKNTGVSPSEKKWLGFISYLINMRHEYDIQISNPNIVHVGVYDIELI